MNGKKAGFLTCFCEALWYLPCLTRVVRLDIVGVAHTLSLVQLNNKRIDPKNKTVFVQFSLCSGGS